MHSPAISCSSDLSSLWDPTRMKQAKSWHKDRIISTRPLLHTVGIAIRKDLAFYKLAESELRLINHTPRLSLSVGSWSNRSHTAPNRLLFDTLTPSSLYWRPGIILSVVLTAEKQCQRNTSPSRHLGLQRRKPPPALCLSHWDLAQVQCQLRLLAFVPALLQ